MNILIKNARILTMDPDNLELENSNIYIEDNRIIGVGVDLEDFVADKTIDATGKVAMPGLINSHTHIGMSILRNVGSDVGLEEWLNKHIWPIESNLTQEDVYYGSLLSVAEMIESGTTTFVDMYYFMDKVAMATQDGGMRAVLTRGMSNPSEQVIQGERDFYKEWHGKANGRIEMMVGCHAVYTNDAVGLQKAVDLADELGVGVHIHLNETQTEVKNSISTHRLPPLEYVDTLGMLNNKTIAAHCVWLNEREKEIARERNITMVHNPASNMKLASGFMEVQNLINSGINVALGTDGVASNNILDMFDEMKLASLIAKGNTLDPTNLNALTVLKMATVNGAKAIGKAKELGMIKEGFLADLILVDFDNIRHIPVHDIVAALVYSTSGFDVDTTIIDGQVVYENKRHLTVDIDLLKGKMQEIYDRISN